MAIDKETTYVINQERQMRFLNTLGFDYVEKKRDLKDTSNYIFIYEKTEELFEAIDFYKKMRFTLKQKFKW